ncbi:epsin-2 [Hemiscyllium ocellatum]|uniref:epsin-2 n=1 Tax=Hemiscyllium ocellatum TaxID=170820 RepID=UPI0029671F34|nr:epsin-2 [Hemiscyllium ocellatum]XP_060696519.1 epsin-2 [Hemiscyllium ocellatum]XP_060696520.1 epsin-2 [Hemiscyllium ocellatum]XP_060696521.1 epsin-2 [Hemiscyllium ocellatum]
MTTSAIRRQMKNIVNNYSEAEIKVREATSNDPWGPSSSLMTEIADLTYNVVAFSEIMSMIWKRLNDHGKNWRHVYKALTLLDYMIKTGSERVAQQCKENIFAIQTLKDFQYIDRDGKDQGINVREKSKQLVALLKDDERLKSERVQALKTKERMAQVATGVGSNNQITFGRGSSQPNLSTSYSEHEYGKSGGSPASYHGSTSPRASSELEQARPQTSGEEELQLQLALAMSREAAEQEDRLRRGDDLRLQMALEESRRNSAVVVGSTAPKKKKASMVTLMDPLPTAATQKPVVWGVSVRPVSIEKNDPWGEASSPVASDPWQSVDTKSTATVDPWGAPTLSATQALPKNVDPWTSDTTSAVLRSSADPWGPGPSTDSVLGSATFDPFSTLNGAAKDDFADFEDLRASSKKTGESDMLEENSKPSGSVSPDLFDSALPSSAPSKQTTARKTPESFLGPNAALVNLDSLVSKPVQPSSISNPFLASAPVQVAQINPFQINQPQPPTLNQMRASPLMASGQTTFGSLPAVSMEPMPHTSMSAPVAMGMVPVPVIGRTGTGMNIAGTMPQPLISTGIPPPTSQTSTTNPFLL